ncbi:sensor histidine kinase [Winogradskyella poriferorum]|uniref:sensor histidine kinase n=1 Tax=Winogradskyella poriferorum TaxID=307627 RepID=UPI003D654015
MNDKRYRYILYLIVTVIVATIAIQLYWNYKNYLNNKQQLVTDVQASLDKAVDNYYTNLAERSTVGVFLEGDQQKNALDEGGELDAIFKQIDSLDKNFKTLDSLKIDNIDGITILRGSKLDSMNVIHEKLFPSTTPDIFKKRIDSLKANTVQLELDDFQMLTSKIVVSITNDSLNLKEVDSLLNQEFERKQIGVQSDLVFFESDVKRQVARIKDSLNNTTPKKENYELKAVSKSTFLPKGSILELNYTNAQLTVLKRSLSGILISTILVLAVISCLFYLLKVIKQQKQLAEVKNDLISNITHEFKTPIATIGVALESISDFNGIDDKEKTKKYINMSSQQLSKLNLMVEKLLETATLDSDNLELNKDEADIITLLTGLMDRYTIQFPDKTFNSNIMVNELVAKIDVFHFENAINNILDNAVKYGGDIIALTLTKDKKNIQIAIADNGNGLAKANKDQIFEKFYRVPKGNKHDVKGFGIGLYYTKSIIEKHSGSISIDLNNNLTTFKITLQYA